MATKKKISLLDPATIVGTFFYSGYSGFAPGTVGSAAAIPFLILLYNFSPAVFNLNLNQGAVYILFLLYFIGAKATQKYMKKTKKHDPKEIVIDEVVGMAITIAIAAPDALSAFCFANSCQIYNEIFTFNNSFFVHSFVQITICFFVFRFYDIFKPSVIRDADKKIDNEHGVMLDDVLAGIAAGITCKLMFDFYNLITNV